MAGTAGTATSPTYDVYVANLPINFSESQIRDIFDVAGEISGVKIIPPKGDNHGKIAFVKFLKEADAQCVAQYMSNYQLPDGRSLTVNYRPHQKSSSNKLINGKPDEAVVVPKADETVVIYVSHVASPIQFYGHTYNKELATKLDSLTKSMEALCPSQPKVVGQLSTDMTYGCKFSLDGMWYRCRIQKCLPKNEIDVLYIDYGNSEITNRFGLVTLPVEVLDLPPLCEFYRVGDLELIDKERTSELFVKGLDLFRSLISEQRIELKIVKKEKDQIVVNILNVLDGSVLDIPEKMITTGAVKKTVAQQKVWLPAKEKTLAKSPITKPSSPTTSSPVKEVKCNKVGEANVSCTEQSQHGQRGGLSTSYTNQLSEYAQKNDIPVPMYITIPVSGKYFSTVTFDGCLYKGIELHAKFNDAETDVARVVLNALTGIPLPINQTSMTWVAGEALPTSGDNTIQVYVSHVESPIRFWGQLYNTELEEKLFELTTTLEDICPTLLKQTDESPSGVYACQFSQDGLWYRCKVERTISNTEVYVRYIDYGNSEATAKDNLVTLSSEIASILPLCTLYTVEGLELTNEESTSEIYREGVHALHDLIGEQKIQIQILKEEGDETMVHVDKVLDGPLLDVGTGLIVNGAVCLKKKDGVTKQTPKPKMIMTSEGGDPEDVQGFTKDTETSDSTSLENATETNDSIDTNCIPTVKPTEVDDSTSITQTIQEDTNNISVEKDEEASTAYTVKDAETTTISAVKDAETNTTPPVLINAETNSQSVMKDVGSNITPVVKDAETNTGKVEKCSEHSCSTELGDTASLDLYVKEIEQKRYEIEELKKKLTAKTNLVDDYLKKIPTPGCKRDLWQLYDDSTCENDGEVTNDNHTLHQQTTSETKITLNDIGSYKKEICELQDLLEGPLLHEKLFEDVGVKPARGILVCGPRGAGKTLIARGVANEVKAFIVELRGRSLMCETTSDIKNTLREAFEQAMKKHPSIIFIDELDKIAPKEGTDKSRIIVSQLINLWCMLKRKPHILLGTLNDDIDPALKGFGLFERKINIPAPNVHQRLDILSTLTKRMNLCTDVCLKKVAEETRGYIASDLATLCNIAGMQVVRRKMSAMKLRKDEGFLVDKTCISGGAFQSTISITVGMQDFKYAISASKPPIPSGNTTKIQNVKFDMTGMHKVKEDLKVASSNVGSTVVLHASRKPSDQVGEIMNSENAVNTNKGMGKKSEASEKINETSLLDGNEAEVIENYTKRNLREMVSDSEVEALNESFESCDSNLDEEEMIRSDVVNGDRDEKVSHDVLCDEPSYQDGDELEAWNTALLNKKTRNPTNVVPTAVEYTNGEDFF